MMKNDICADDKSIINNSELITTSNRTQDEPQLAYIKNQMMHFRFEKEISAGDSKDEINQNNNTFSSNYIRDKMILG